MTEPAVTLTDYALAVESAVFVIALSRLNSRDKELCLWFVVFFASIGAASILEGTVHGFFLPALSQGRRILWPATILAILITSLAAWNIGAVLHLSERRAVLVRRLAIAQLVIFSLFVLFVSSKYYVGIIAYLPSTLFLLFTFITAYRRRADAGVRWGVAGLALTLVAAAVQPSCRNSSDLLRSQRALPRHSGRRTRDDLRRCQIDLPCLAAIPEES